MVMLHSATLVHVATNKRECSNVAVRVFATKLRRAAISTSRVFVTGAGPRLSSEERPVALSEQYRTDIDAALQQHFGGFACSKKEVRMEIMQFGYSSGSC